VPVSCHCHVVEAVGLHHAPGEGGGEGAGDGDGAGAGAGAGAGVGVGAGDEVGVGAGAELETVVPSEPPPQAARKSDSRTLPAGWDAMGGLFILCWSRDARFLASSMGAGALSEPGRAVSARLQHAARQGRSPMISRIRRVACPDAVRLERPPSRPSSGGGPFASSSRVSAGYSSPHACPARDAMGQSIP